MPAPRIALCEIFPPQEVPEYVVERFWSRVAEGKGGCLIWQGQLSVGGYGMFLVRKPTRMYAHRFAYELMIGRIPEGLELDHLCRNRACVNTLHLEPVTHAENRARTPRKRSCPRGHEYTPENIRTWVKKDGVISRACRQCQRERARAWRDKKRQTKTKPRGRAE